MQNCSLFANQILAVQVLFQNVNFHWQSAEKLLGLAKEGSGGLDITSTVRDAVKVVLLDDKLRMQLVNAFTEDNKLHIEVSRMLQSFRSPGRYTGQGIQSKTRKASFEQGKTRKWVFPLHCICSKVKKSRLFALGSWRIDLPTCCIH